MPTINEVWEQAQQINANLVTVQGELTTIHGDLTGLQQEVDESNDWLGEIRQLTANGFAALATGIVGIHTRQDISNDLLWVLIQQMQSALCNLEKISQNTCRLVTESVKQTEIQRATAASTADLRQMYASANPAAALELARAREQEKRMDECCPPPRPKPACSYEPCPAPQIPERRRPPGWDGFHPGPSQVEDRDGRRGPG